MDTLLLTHYLNAFGDLNQNSNPDWGKAPHKPVLLLAVLDEIERGTIAANFIELNEALILAFQYRWQSLVPPKTWKDKIANPFRFMVNEGFWTLTKNGVPVSTQSLGNNPTIRQLTTEVDGAVLDGDLWKLLQDPTALQALRTHLLQTYFSQVASADAAQLPANPVDYEIERLKAEAQSKFRIREVRDLSDSAGYYVRHRLFPKIIKDIYQHSCAVCALKVQSDDGKTLVQAAHIMPFHLFHNDHPRNGIAFCQNHHEGFDRGWFTISNKYTVIVSPHIHSVGNYLTANAPLFLPNNPDLAPAPQALKWHRENGYKA